MRGWLADGNFARGGVQGGGRLNTFAAFAARCGRGSAWASVKGAGDEPGRLAHEGDLTGSHQIPRLSTRIMHAHRTTGQFHDGELGSSATCWDPEGSIARIPLARIPLARIQNTGISPTHRAQVSELQDPSFDRRLQSLMTRWQRRTDVAVRWKVREKVRLRAIFLSQTARISLLAALVLGSVLDGLHVQ